MSINEANSTGVITATAGEAIGEGLFVNWTGTTDGNLVATLADSGDDAMGVSGNAAASGDLVQVILPGNIAYLYCDGTTDIAAMDHIKPNTDSSGNGILAANPARAAARALEPLTENASRKIRVQVLQAYTVP